MRALVAAAFALSACSSSSAPDAATDAGTEDANAAPDARARDATEDAADAPIEAATPTEIVVDAASFAVADGGALACGGAYDGVQVFYAIASAPVPNETGVLPCTAPIVITPVEADATYQLDVYLQQGANVVAQATCSAATRAGQAVAPICPPFM